MRLPVTFDGTDDARRRLPCPREQHPA
jgi:hypothetical protein